MALWLLLACIPLPVDDDIVTGVQVVTVVADPPQVDPFARVRLEAWVAEPRDLGADVLIWPCTPTDLGDRIRCAEGLDLAQRGIPLSNFVHVGTAVDNVVAWDTTPPIQSILALQAAADDFEEGLPIPVFVLACEPGVCPIVDQVLADPEPATEAYARAARLLADPEQLAEQGPRESVSLALKFYTLATEETQRSSIPRITPLARREVPQVDLVRWRFLVEDTSPEAEQPLAWSVDAKYTTGRMVERRFRGDELELTWSPMGDPLDGTMVVAVSDGRGGTTALSVELPADVGRPDDAAVGPDEPEIGR